MSHRYSSIGWPATSAGLRIIILTVVCLFLTSGPVFSIWLPWATDENKVKKTVADIWRALLLNDQLTVMQNVTGSGAGKFFARERGLILREKISDYTCENYKINFDPQTGTFAFVEFDKTAFLQSGGKKASTEVWVLQKIGGNWVVQTDMPKKRRPPQDLRRLKEEALKQFNKDFPAPSENKSPSDEPPTAEVSF